MLTFDDQVRPRWGRFGTSTFGQGGRVDGHTAPTCATFSILGWDPETGMSGGGVWLNNGVVLRRQVDDSEEPIRALRRPVDKAHERFGWER